MYTIRRHELVSYLSSFYATGEVRLLQATADFEWNDGEDIQTEQYEIEGLPGIIAKFPDKTDVNILFDRINEITRSGGIAYLRVDGIVGFGGDPQAWLNCLQYAGEIHIGLSEEDTPLLVTKSSADHFSFTCVPLVSAVRGASFVKASGENTEKRVFAWRYTGIDNDNVNNPTKGMKLVGIDDAEGYLRSVGCVDLSAFHNKLLPDKLTLIEQVTSKGISIVSIDTRESTLRILGHSKTNPTSKAIARKHKSLRDITLIEAQNIVVDMNFFELGIYDDYLYNYDKLFTEALIYRVLNYGENYFLLIDGPADERARIVFRLMAHFVNKKEQNAKYVLNIESNPRYYVIHREGPTGERFATAYFCPDDKSIL